MRAGVWAVVLSPQNGLFFYLLFCTILTILLADGFSMQCGGKTLHVVFCGFFQHGIEGKPSLSCPIDFFSMWVFSTHCGGCPCMSCCVLYVFLMEGFSSTSDF